MSEANPFASEPKPPVKTPPTSDERTMAMLAHLLGVLLIFLGGAPGFVGPLIIWLMKKEESVFIEDQAKEALNFQLTMLIAYGVAIVLTLVSCGFLVFLAIVPPVLQFVFGIIGTIKANNGEYYRYPLCWRMIQ